MRILLIFTLLSFTGVSSFTVKGFSGGNVIIYCNYVKEERSNEKYFYMGHPTSKDMIRSGIRKSWYHSKKVSLYDDTEGNYFIVVIRELTRQDEGTYWCGVDKPGYDSYTKVDLEVKEDKCCKRTIRETAYLGGEATIICNYPEDHVHSIKYFCKERNYLKTCYYMISGYYTYQKTKAMKYYLTDNRTERRYTVSISNLTEDDTGTYWCGVNPGYITLFTKIQLLVIEPTTTSVKPASTSSSPSTPPATTYLSTMVTINHHQPSSLSFASSSSPSSSMSRFTDTVVMLMCVSVVVLLIVIILIIVYRWRYNNTTGSVSTKQRGSPGTGNHQEGCHSDGDYEDIKERILQSDTGRVTAIDATANFPRNLCDSVLYTNINFHKNDEVPNEATTSISKDDSSCCVYATVNVG